MKKQFVGLAMAILLLLYPLVSFAEEGNPYPMKALFPEGIDNVNSSLFSNSKIKRPIETDFEERSELSVLSKENQSGQLIISEDAYSGKFALKIQKLQENILPIRETEYFRITDITPSTMANVEPMALSENADFSLRINDKTVMVSGVKASNEMVSLLVKEGDNIAYIDQTNADANGFYDFTFSLDDYGTYQLSIGGSESTVMRTNFVLDGKNISKPTQAPKPVEPTLGVDVKCNFYTAMIKPMYLSENISFYVKVECDDGNGNITEQYALIKSDKDCDGVYKIGEDLSRGKWQNVQLNLMDIDEAYRNCSVSGLYMNANQDSEWLFDDITSGYKKVNETKFDLSEFEKENVVYTDEGLRFANNTQSEDYDVRSKVVFGDMSISEQLSTIKINSKIEFSSNNMVYQDDDKVIYYVPLESEEWVVNDADYNTSATGVSKKETVSIENEGGEKTLICIVMRSQGNVSTILKDIATEERVKISYDLINKNLGNLKGGTQLELFEGDAESPYYATRSNFKSFLKEQTISHIVPKIRPNTKIKITNLEPQTSGTTYDEICLANIKITELKDKDWDIREQYASHNLTYRAMADSFESSGGHLKRTTAGELCSDAEKYAIVYQNVAGIVNDDNNMWQLIDEYRDIEYDFAIYKILNLSTEPVSVNLGSKIVWLHYGLANYYLETASISVTLPANPKVMLISKEFYTNETVNLDNSYYTHIDGISSGVFVEKENAMLYANVYDGNRPYIYNLETEKSTKLSDDELLSISPDGAYLLLKGNNDYCYVLNRETMHKNETSVWYYNSSGLYQEQYFIGNNSEWFYSNYRNTASTANGYIRTHSLYYNNSDGLQLVDTITSTDYMSSHAFDTSGKYLLWSVGSGIRLYQKVNGIWNRIAEIGVAGTITNCMLSNDLSVAYVQVGDDVYSIDLNTKTSELLLKKTSILQLTENNMLLINQEDCYYLYNPVTDVKYKIFNHAFTCNSICYNPETNLIVGIMPNGSIFRHHFSTEQPEAKFALSFDGRNNWYAYSGGRWITVSKENTPNKEEMRLSGMTAEIVNSIPSSAYDKLYSDGSDILTVDVAIYMYSNSNNQTPMIEDITVTTIEKDDLSGLYGIHLEKYPKDEYRSVSALFPIENFGSNAECYYLLYIGNDWLYTYKNNELVKVEEPADILLEDMTQSWITFKQYGMNAQELRSIPSDVLSNLFVNDEYANTEFGVIYVVKTADEDTTDYTVTFRLSSSSNYITEDDIVVEIMMNGGDVKVIDSQEFSAEDIENLLSWIEARQNGSGEVFYRLKNDKNQHFINYYMINSISVYNGEEYRSQITE